MDLVSALRLEPSSQSSASKRRPQVVSFTGGGGKTSTMRRLAGELAGRGQRVVCTSTTRLAAYEVEASPGVVLVGEARLPFDQIAVALGLHTQCLLVTPEIVDGDLPKYPGIAPDLVDELALRAAEYGIDAIVVEADGAKMLPLKGPAEHEPSLPSSTTLLAPVAGMDALGLRIEASLVHRPEQIRKVLGLALDAEARVTPARLAELLVSPAGGRKGLTPRTRFLPILNKAESAAYLAGARVAACQITQSHTPCLIATTGNREREPVRERWGPIAVVILAAGEGKRFGSPKQLATFDGEPMVVRAVNTALCAGCADVVVVTGAYADDVAACLERSLEAPPSNVRLVHNSDWEGGQATSLHAALRGIGDEYEAALFMPVDQPLLSPVLLRKLVGLWRSGYALAAPRVDGTVRGSPALFDRDFWPELLRIDGDVGGRELLRRHAELVGTAEVDGQMLRDIDTTDQMQP